MAVAALTALFVCNPAGSSLFPPCPCRAATGLCCPGCGTLRGLHQLLHGHVGAAFRLNPLMLLSLPFLAYPLVSRLLHALTGRSLPGVFIRPFWIWTLLGVIVLFWILRNLPLYPFTLLTA